MYQPCYVTLYYELLKRQNVVTMYPDMVEYVH